MTRECPRVSSQNLDGKKGVARIHDTLVRLAPKEHCARVTKLVLAYTIVLAVRDGPLANIDHAIDRQLRREGNIKRTV